MIDELVLFVNGDPTKTLDVQLAEQTAALEGGIDSMESGLQSKIDDMSDYLSGYRIDASDTVYMETDNPLYTVAEGATYNIPISIKINLSGIIRLKYTYSRLNVYIYKNGVQIDNEFDSDSNISASTDYTVEKGDVITFKIKGRGSSTANNKFHADTLNVCGYITPIMETNLIEVEG